MSEGYKYKRVLLKLSGEALAGDAGYGIDPKVVEDLAVQIKDIVKDGVELAVVVGGGNIFRGMAASAEAESQKLTDSYVAQIEEAFKKKEAEVMEI